MGITGSQMAYRQNRAGIARAATMRVVLNKNDDPDHADFLIKPNAGFTPTAGQTVSICLGASTNPVFAGQIMQLLRERVLGEPYPFFRVVCGDWSRLFNRRLITRDFSGQSATDIATSIVSDYTSGFTTEAIEPSLATIDEFVCTNETPTAAFTRLANLLGGGFFVDARKIVHLWNSSGPSSNYTPSPPVTLTTSLGTLKQFTPQYDFSQARTRVIVEGFQGQTVFAIPASADVLTYGIPLNDIWVRFNQSTDADANRARIGTLVVSYDHVAFTAGAGILDGDALAGDSSFSVVGVGGLTPGLDPPGWFTADNENYWYAAGPTAPYGPPAGTAISGVPTSGYGAIPVDLPSGTIVYQVPYLVDVTITAAITEEIPAGTSLVVRAQKDDAAAQAAIAAIEGGDGIHEHIVSDGDLSYAGCLQRAEAELDLFGATLVRASWLTYDMAAVPGAEQVINWSGADTVSATLMIDTVTLTFPLGTHPPLRSCQGSTVKLATVLDAIRG
jgi:hypothetical protein